jgi:TrmH RNA methyltransferase
VTDTKRSQQDEVKVYGFHACAALEKARRQDIIRVYVTEPLVKKMGGLLSWCAKNRRAYHIVSPVDMEKISGTDHHEGICILAKTTNTPGLYSFLEALDAGTTKPLRLIVCDKISNPHNIGAILRSAAHFGAKALLAQNLKLTSSSYRVAEGGAEAVPVVSFESWQELKDALKNRGVVFLGCDGAAEHSLYAQALPAKAAIILGNENSGLSKEARTVCDQMISIPGTGAVESLNVSAAAAVILSEHVRQYP